MKLTSIITDPREKERFLKFALVGTFGAAVDFGTFHLLVSVLAVNAVLSSVLSFTAAITSNFIWNRFWTYPDSRSKPLHHQLITFLPGQTSSDWEFEPRFLPVWRARCAVFLWALKSFPSGS